MREREGAYVHHFGDSRFSLDFEIQCRGALCFCIKCVCKCMCVRACTHAREAVQGWKLISARGDAKGSPTHLDLDLDCFIATLPVDLRLPVALLPVAHRGLLLEIKQVPSGQLHRGLGLPQR